MSVDDRCWPIVFHYIADNLRKYHDDALLQQDVDEREKRTALHTDLTQYWATYQREEDSRDADLNCGLKGAVRITIPEDELGPASMQIFQVGSVGEAGAWRASMTGGTESSEWLIK